MKYYHYFMIYADIYLHLGCFDHYISVGMLSNFSLSVRNIQEYKKYIFFVLV